MKQVELASREALTAICSAQNTDSWFEAVVTAR
jgi:hypothetical protein